MIGLDNIAVFVKVIQTGSFSQAARLLGMPNTTVSAKVADLEKRLGVTLIQRTTRKLNVTQAGEAYFRKCVQALEDIQNAEAEVTSSQEAPRGILRITSAVDVGHTLLPPIVQEFITKYPKIKVDLLITNRVVDLVAEGIDIAFRAGELEDSSMIAKKFVASHMKMWASPSYLKKRGIPSHPSELSQHEFVRFTSFTEDTIELTNGKEKVILSPTGRISADDLEIIKVFSTLGEGIGLFPGFLCEEEAKLKKIIPVLPEWYWGSGHFSIVYPYQKFVSPKIHAFLEVASEYGKACQTRTTY